MYPEYTDNALAETIRQAKLERNAVVASAVRGLFARIASVFKRPMIGHSSHV